MKITLRYREFIPRSTVAEGQEHFKELIAPDNLDARDLCVRLGINLIAEYTGYGDSGYRTGPWINKGHLKDRTTYVISIGDKKKQKDFLKKLDKLDFL